MCNVPRRPYNFSLNSEKVICSSTTYTCVRERYSPEEILIPDALHSNSSYQQAYIENFKSIAGGLVMLGKVQSVFNVRLSSTDMKVSIEEIIEALTQIHSNQIFEYRVAISMGALLERPPSPDSEGKTGELDILYFHPSSNNPSLFWLEDDKQSNYRYIRKNLDLEGSKIFLRDKEWTSRQVDTSWSLVGNVNANIYIVRVHGAEGGLIGHLKSIPGFLLRRGLQHFHRDTKNKRVIKDNLCFFRCLSYYLFKDIYHSGELLQVFFPNETPATYKGIALSHLNRI